MTFSTLMEQCGALRMNPRSRIREAKSVCFCHLLLKQHQARRRKVMEKEVKAKTEKKEQQLKKNQMNQKSQKNPRKPLRRFSSMTLFLTIARTLFLELS